MEFQAEDFTKTLIRLAKNKDFYPIRNVHITTGKEGIKLIDEQLLKIEASWEVTNGNYLIKYEGLILNVYFAEHLENKTMHKNLHPNGGLESSYECNMILF